MEVPTSEVGYTSATTGRGDHEVYKGHVVALKKKNFRRKKAGVMYNQKMSLIIVFHQDGMSTLTA
jgi:hypothetical protein